VLGAVLLLATAAFAGNIGHFPPHQQEFANYTCPCGFDLVQNECRGKYLTMDIRDDIAANVAMAKCNEIQGIPVIIRNDEEHSYWTEQAAKMPGVFVLGLICDPNSRVWTWADGSVVNYKPPYGHYLTDLDRECTNGCVWFIYGGNAGWYLWCRKDDVDTFDIFCTTQPLNSTNNHK
ncbi:hypothetical protein PENTCL1PPCAC_8328, partial [Pristionchus entomophagus]